jgi:chromosome segregation ATPase
MSDSPRTPIYDEMRELGNPAETMRALYKMEIELAAKDAELSKYKEDEAGLLADIQRLTEEAFKRDAELAAARREKSALQAQLAGVERDNNMLASDLLGTRKLYETSQQLLLEAEDRSVQHLGAAIQEKAKREQAEKDAQRYRWLRKGEPKTYNNVLIHAGGKLDAAIDAAMQGGRDASDA